MVRKRKSKTCARTDDSRSDLPPKYGKVDGSLVDKIVIANSKNKRNNI